MTEMPHVQPSSTKAGRLHIRWKPESYWLVSIAVLLALYLIGTASGGWIVGYPSSRDGSLTILLLCAHISILLLVMHIVSILMLTHISTGLFTSWAYRKRLRDIWTWLPAAMFLAGNVWPLVVMAHSGQPVWPWWWTEWAMGMAVANLLLVIPLIQSLMRSVTPKYYLKSLIGWEAVREADLKSELSGECTQTWRLVLHDMMQRSIAEGRLLVLKDILNALEKRAVKLLKLARAEDTAALAASISVIFADALGMAHNSHSLLAAQAIQAKLRALASFCLGKGLTGAAEVFTLLSRSADGK